MTKDIVETFKKLKTWQKIVCAIPFFIIFFIILFMKILSGKGDSDSFEHLVKKTKEKVDDSVKKTERKEAELSGKDKELEKNGLEITAVINRNIGDANDTEKSIGADASGDELTSELRRLNKRSRNRKES